jgi:uncharacterized membrane protein YkvA (DUF1232 family)
MNLVQIRRYFRDSKVPGWRKFAVVGAMAYVLSPVDFVPDLIPLLGWLDDVGVVGAALAFFARDVANHSSKSSSMPTVSEVESGAGVQIVDAAPIRSR